MVCVILDKHKTCNQDKYAIIHLTKSESKMKSLLKTKL